MELLRFSPSTFQKTNYPVRFVSVSNCYTSLPNLIFVFIRKCAGPIPTELGQLAAMTRLWLENNRLTGEFLHAPCTSTVHEYTESDFRVQKCSGPIPTELEQLTTMTWLNLRKNKLTGRFLFADCKSMHGTRVSQTIDFLPRLCAGSIPTELGQLTAMKGFLLDNNQLTGGFLLIAYRKRVYRIDTIMYFLPYWCCCQS